KQRFVGHYRDKGLWLMSESKVFFKFAPPGLPAGAACGDRASGKPLSERTKLIIPVMLRTHTCGELRLPDVNKTVTLAGWVQRTRDKGGVLWVDLRDRYGITQLIFDETTTDPETLKTARQLGREYVVQAEGTVVERLAKNDRMPTGDIEIKVSRLTILNAAKVPPFTIDDNT